jgi:hypothetical protein
MSEVRRHRLLTNSQAGQNASDVHAREVADDLQSDPDAKNDRCQSDRMLATCPLRINILSTANVCPEPTQDSSAGKGEETAHKGTGLKARNWIELQTFQINLNKRGWKGGGVPMLDDSKLVVVTEASRRSKVFLNEGSAIVPPNYKIRQPLRRTYKEHVPINEVSKPKRTPAQAPTIADSR